MPQNTVNAAWRAGFPILQPAQKPGGVTVATTLAANAMPNKAMWATPTIQSAVDIQAAADAKPGTIVEREKVEHEEEDYRPAHPAARRGHDSRRNQLEQAKSHAERAQRHAGEAEEQASEAKEHIDEAAKNNHPRKK